MVHRVGNEDRPALRKIVRDQFRGVPRVQVDKIILPDQGSSVFRNPAFFLRELRLALHDTLVQHRHLGMVHGDRSAVHLDQHAFLVHRRQIPADRGFRNAQALNQVGNLDAPLQVNDRQDP